MKEYPQYIQQLIVIDPTCRVGEKQFGDKCVFLGRVNPNKTKEWADAWCSTNEKDFEGEVYAPLTNEDNVKLKNWISTWSKYQHFRRV